MRHRTMAEYALEQLREAIILGELPAGTPLRLDELARSLGMSISPIREAVRQLEALGLAKHVPHQGAKVLDFDVEELRDLFQVRLALESLAVRRGGRAVHRRGRRGGAEAPGALRRDARGRRRPSDDARAHRLPLHALRGLADAWLVALIRPAWDRSERFRPALLASAGEPQDLHRVFDERLLAACVAHDPQAAADALYEHLEHASVFFKTELGGKGIFDPR